ncbi:MAG: NADH-quinone oxidoreductase subunit J [Anaerolineaceae bacterium]
MDLSTVLPGYIVFGVLGLMAIGTAAAMLLSRQPVFAVLFLVLNFATIAVLYLILGAPFIALTQIAVYAGAIMVLFLFVVMMLGTEELSFLGPLKGQRWLVGALLAVFLLLVGIFLGTRMGGEAPLAGPPSDFGSPHAIGSLLMDQYVLPIWIIGVSILAATIGAVVLTRREGKQLPIIEKTSTPAETVEEK